MKTARALAVAVAAVGVALVVEAVVAVVVGRYFLAYAAGAVGAWTLLYSWWWR